MLTNKKIQALCMKHPAGELNFYVRDGQLQKTIYPGARLLGVGEESCGMTEMVYKNLVKLIGNAVRKSEEEYEICTFRLYYKVGSDGELCEVDFYPIYEEHHSRR
jgi:hypothetical protein